MSLRDADGLYAGPIVDAHHHLWDRSLCRHPWLLEASQGVLAQDCMPADYQRDAKAYDIVGTVHVEAGWDASDPFGEIAWIDALEKPATMATRYVAAAQLADPGAAAVLERHAAHGKVAGIREIMSWHPEPAKSFAKDRHRMSDPGLARGPTRIGKARAEF
jgi:predicted TIM-barrel fold metal-dependent hydrolase